VFGEFYDRNQPSILRYFLRHTSSIDTATELTAETFAQALACLHRYDPRRGSGSVWLFGIAAHQYHHFLRRGEVDKRRRARLRMTTSWTTTDDLDRVAELIDGAEVVHRLRLALGELSDGVRAAVELRVAFELPYAEVAARLGCTEGNARVRVARGMRHLVASMGPE
jgi:RNA polymerase sigma-70 factor (ECF subfamily)